jgi:catechol 2,3-dioxygenase-like lactoylglutathione lyase family enzyme
MNRREFVQRAFLFVAAHTALKGLAQDEKPQDQRPVEFRRIRLHTAKLPELRDFYSQKLGLPVADSGELLQVQAGQSIIEFAGGAPGTQPYYHFAFNIPENRLAESMDWLRPRCPIFKNPETGQEIYHFVNWDAHSFYFLDPAGNILEFIARHTLRNASPIKFDVDSILSVSEIALVAPQLPILADRLKANLGVREYHGNSPEFMPVGNEHGLFILVRTGRNWLGGDLHAAEYPVDVKVSGDRLQRLSWDKLPYTVETTLTG